MKKLLGRAQCHILISPHLATIGLPHLGHSPGRSGWASPRCPFVSAYFITSSKFLPAKIPATALLLVLQLLPDMSQVRY